MCGHVGFIRKRWTYDGQQGSANDQIQKALYELMIVGQVRGEHGTGAQIWAKTGKKMLRSVPKVAATPDVFFNQFPQPLMFTRDMLVWMGHHRYATRGAHTVDNTHPFPGDRITLAHNGVIRNTYQLGCEKTHDVDSQYIHEMLEKQRPLEEILALAEGAWCFAWSDLEECTFHFYRNEARTLWFAETDYGWFYASERGMLTWVLSRNGVKPIENGIYPLPPYEHWKFSWSGAMHDNTVDIVKLEKFALTAEQEKAAKEAEEKAKKEKEAAERAASWKQTYSHTSTSMTQPPHGVGGTKATDTNVVYTSFWERKRKWKSDGVWDILDQETQEFIEHYHSSLKFGSSEIVRMHHANVKMKLPQKGVPHTSGHYMPIMKNSRMMDPNILHNVGQHIFFMITKEISFDKALEYADKEELQTLHVFDPKIALKDYQVYNSDIAYIMGESPLFMGGTTKEYKVISLIKKDELRAAMHYKVLLSGKITERFVDDEGVDVYVISNPTATALMDPAFHGKDVAVAA